MLKQFISSIIARFVEIEPMNAYIQEVPEGVKYPCYLVNKCDIKSTMINSYYYMNTIFLYVRIFGNDELEIKGRANNVVQTVLSELGKIPILNEDGTKSRRYVRVEDFDTIDIKVDENEVYCVELNFNFDTTHRVTLQEFELMKNTKITQA